MHEKIIMKLCFLPKTGTFIKIQPCHYYNCPAYLFVTSYVLHFKLKIDPTIVNHTSKIIVKTLVNLVSVNLFLCGFNLLPSADKCGHV